MNEIRIVGELSPSGAACRANMCSFYLSELVSQTEASRLFRASLTSLHDRTPPPFVLVQLKSNTVNGLANIQHTQKKDRKVLDYYHGKPNSVV